MYLSIAYRCQPIKICILHFAIFFQLSICTYVCISTVYHCIYCTCLPEETNVKMSNKLINMDNLDLEESLGWNSLLRSSDYLTDHNRVPCNIDDLTVVQLNIRGIQSKICEFKLLLNQILKTDQPDIILLCETWLQPSHPNPHIPGYQMVRKDRTSKKGGGVCILISNQLGYKIRDDLIFDCETFELVVIELKCKSDSIICCSGYRPPNTTPALFVKNFSQQVEMLQQVNKKIIIGIDHNMDLLKTDRHHSTQDLLNSLLDLKLSPTILRPTRICHTAATLIDNIFISEELDKGRNCSYIMVENISDHLPCILNIPGIHRGLKERVSITYRDKKHLSELIESLKATEWSNIVDYDSPLEDTFNNFHSHLLKRIDQFLPYQTIEVHNHKLRREPWLTKGLEKSMKRCKMLYQKQLHGNESTKAKFKNYRYVLNKVKRTAKRQYYIDRCVTMKSDTKKLWQTLNNVIGKHKDRTCCIDSLRVDNLTITSPAEISDKMCDYFSSVGKNYANKIQKSKKDINSYLSKIRQNCNSMTFTQVNRTELLKLFKELPNKSSHGHDNLDNILLKEISEGIVDPLVILFNRSLDEGYFPNQMKIAEVVPLFKSKERDIANNYRPISLLMVISKLLERIVYKRTFQFITDTGQLYESQYGFRKHHSCNDAISELLGEILHNLENNKYTVAIYLDLSKAFDTLQHSVILKKLECYGIRGKCLQWFASYFKDRYMSVKIQTRSGTIEKSDLRSVEYGTPQGSCLGPLVFLLFCNDLYLHIDHLNSIQFADDTTLYHGSRYLNYSRFCIESDIECIEDWFAANKLTLNIGKTVMMLFQPNKGKKRNTTQDPSKFSVNLLGSQIPCRSQTKFLGLTIDDKLNWDSHIKNIMLKIRSRIGLLRKGKNLLTRHAKKILYYAQIHSVLQYGLVVWGPLSSKGNLSKLQKIQNKCVQLIDPRVAVATIYKEHKIPRLTDMIFTECCKLWHRYSLKLLPSKLSAIMTKDSKQKSLIKTHRYGTRNKKVLNTPLAMTNLYKNSFFVSGLTKYQSLQQATRDVRDIDIFSKTLKQQLSGN